MNGNMKRVIILLLIFSMVILPISQVKADVVNENDYGYVFTYDVNTEQTQYFGKNDTVYMELYVSVIPIAYQYNITVDVYHDTNGSISETILDISYNFTGNDEYDYVSETGDYLIFNNTLDYGLYWIELLVSDGINDYIYFYNFNVINPVGWINGRICDQEDCGFGDDQTIFYQNQTAWIDGNAGVHLSGINNVTISVVFNKGGGFGVSPIEILNETYSFDYPDAVCFLSFNGGIGTPFNLNVPPNIYPVVFEINKPNEMQSQILLYYIRVVSYDFGTVQTSLNLYDNSNIKTNCFVNGSTIKMNGTIEFNEDKNDIQILTELYKVGSEDSPYEIINDTFDFIANNEQIQSTDLYGSEIELDINEIGRYYIKTTILKNETIIHENTEYFEIIEIESVFISLQTVIISLLSMIIVLYIISKVLKNIWDNNMHGG